MLLAGLSCRAPQASALDLGLTPSEVFSMWTNIQASQLAVARVISDDEAWLDELKAVTPRRFHDKTPADVLKQVRRYCRMFDRLRQRSGLPPRVRQVMETETVTPSVVYLSSGHVLTSQAEWLVRNTDARQLLSPFFERHEFTGKTPSDVFALVDVANRRIDRILLRTGLMLPEGAP